MLEDWIDEDCRTVVTAVAIAVIGAVLALTGRVWVRLIKRVWEYVMVRRLESGRSVRWIRSSKHRAFSKHFQDAMGLLAARLPPNEVDEESRVELWLDGCWKRLRQGPPFDTIQYFIVQPWKGEVLSVLFAQYYARHRLMFVSYTAAVGRKSHQDRTVSEIDNLCESRDSPRDKSVPKIDSLCESLVAWLDRRM